MVHELNRMGLPILKDLQVTKSTIKGIAGVTDIVKDQILTIQPIGGSSLRIDTQIIVVHRANLHIIHKQIDHVGAVGSDAIGQPVNMACGAIDAMVRKHNTEILMTCRVTITQRQKAAVGVTEQEGCIVRVAAVRGGQQESTAGQSAIGLPFHTPGAVMHQHDFIIQTISRLGVDAIGKRASVHSSVILSKVAGGRGQCITGSIPAEIIGLILRNAICPNLQIGHIHIIHGVTVGTDVAEGKVTTIKPVRSGILSGGIDVVVVHRAQFHAIYTQIDHVGAIGGDFICQPVDMLCRAVNAVIGQCQTIVVVLCAIPCTKGDETTFLKPEQVRRVSNTISALGCQHHCAAAKATRGLPLNHPWHIVLQNHSAAQTENGLAHDVIVDVAMEALCPVEHVAAISNRNQFIVNGLPTEIVGTGGTHRGIVGIAVEVTHRIIVGVRSGFPALHTEVKLTGHRTNSHILDFKQAGIVTADNTERQTGIVSQIACGTFQIIHRDNTVVDGLNIGVTGKGQEHLAVVVIETLLGKRGEINNASLQPDFGNIQGAQFCQLNVTAGCSGIKRAGIQSTATLDQNLNLGIAGRHNLGSSHTGSRTIVGSGVGTGSGQSGAVDNQPNQRSATGNKQLLLTIDGHRIQCIGMTQIAEIIGARGSVGHIGL